MKGVAASSEARGLKIQLSFLITPSVIQPSQVGVIGVPANRSSEETSTAIVREEADPLHAIQDRTLMVAQVDRPGDVRR